MDERFYPDLGIPASTSFVRITDLADALDNIGKVRSATVTAVYGDNTIDVELNNASATPVNGVQVIAGTESEVDDTVVLLESEGTYYSIGNPDRYSTRLKGGIIDAIGSLGFPNGYLDIEIGGTVVENVPLIGGASAGKVGDIVLVLETETFQVCLGTFAGTGGWQSERSATAIMFETIGSVPFQFDSSVYLGNATVASNRVRPQSYIDSGDASTLTSAQSYADSGDAAKLSLSGGTMTGAIAMGTNKITGAGDPTAAQDVATKAYVDQLPATVRRELSTDKAISTSTITNVDFDTEIFDDLPGGEITWDSTNKQFDVNADCTIEMSVQLWWESNSTGSRIGWIELNPSSDQRRLVVHRRSASTSSEIAMHLGPIRVVNGDVLAVRVFQDSGASRSLDVKTDGPRWYPAVQVTVQRLN